MQKSALVLAVAALFSLPMSAFSQDDEGFGYHYGNHTTKAITIALGVMANARNYVLLVCTRRSWAKKVRKTANDIAKCAGEDSFATPLPAGRPPLFQKPTKREPERSPAVVCE